MHKHDCCFACPRLWWRWLWLWLVARPGQDAMALLNDSKVFRERASPCAAPVSLTLGNSYDNEEEFVGVCHLEYVYCVCDMRMELSRL